MLHRIQRYASHAGGQRFKSSTAHFLLGLTPLLDKSPGHTADSERIKRSGISFHNADVVCHRVALKCLTFVLNKRTIPDLIRHEAYLQRAFPVRSTAMVLVRVERKMSGKRFLCLSLVAADVRLHQRILIGYPGMRRRRSGCDPGTSRSVPVAAGFASQALGCRTEAIRPQA